MLSGYYKNNTPFDERLTSSLTLKAKHPSRLPCILEYGAKETIPFLQQTKFLVPVDKTFGEFSMMIRCKLKVKPHKALFFFTNNKIPVFSKTFSEIYEEHKDIDGFLYIIVSTENCFGSSSN